MNRQHTAEKAFTQVGSGRVNSLGHFPSNVQYFTNILICWMQLCGQRPKRILNCTVQLFALELLPWHQCSRCSQNITLSLLGLQIQKSVEPLHQRWPQDVLNGLSCLFVDIWKSFSGVCCLCFNLLDCHPLDVPVSKNTSIPLAHAGLVIWVAVLHD